MALKDILVKAGLLEEVEPGTPSQKDEKPALNFSVPESPPEKTPPALSEIDRRLAAMDAKMAEIKTPTTPRTAKEIADTAAGPALQEIQKAASTSPPPLQEDGTLEFATIYQRAGLPTVPFSAEQTLEMIEKMPKELPLDVKRQMMQVTLQGMGAAIGASAETIVADATRKLVALNAFTESVGKTTQEYQQKAQAEIAELEKRIEERKQGVLKAQAREQQVHRLCDTEAERLDDILEFFSLDTGASKYATPTPPPLPGQPQ